MENFDYSRELLSSITQLGQDLAKNHEEYIKQNGDLMGKLADKRKF
jgi:hypothetical protein